MIGDFNENAGLAELTTLYPSVHSEPYLNYLNGSYIGQTELPLLLLIDLSEKNHVIQEVQRFDLILSKAFSRPTAKLLNQLNPNLVRGCLLIENEKLQGTMERQLFVLNDVWNAFEVKYVPNGKNVAKKKRQKWKELGHLGPFLALEGVEAKRGFRLNK